MGEWLCGGGRGEVVDVAERLRRRPEEEQLQSGLGCVAMLVYMQRKLSPRLPRGNRSATLAQPLGQPFMEDNLPSTLLSSDVHLHLHFRALARTGGVRVEYWQGMLATPREAPVDISSKDCIIETLRSWDVAKTDDLVEALSRISRSLRESAF